MLGRKGRTDKGVREVGSTDFIGIRNVTTVIAGFHSQQIAGCIPTSAVGLLKGSQINNLTLCAPASLTVKYCQ